jgi:hypothetical protein
MQQARGAPLLLLLSLLLLLLLLLLVCDNQFSRGCAPHWAPASRLGKECVTLGASVALG